MLGNVLPGGGSQTESSGLLPFECFTSVPLTFGSSCDEDHTINLRNMFLHPNL